MNNNLSIVLTKARNPASYAIRYALPRSRFALAKSSHAVIVDGDCGIEARMLYRDGGKWNSGVRRVPLGQAIGGATVVAQLNFLVPDAESGLSFAREQVGRDYDYAGAFGLAIAPDREWQLDDAWFCYELAAMTIHAAGRKLFSSVGHITEREFLGVIG